MTTAGHLRCARSSRRADTAGSGRRANHSPRILTRQSLLEGEHHVFLPMVPSKLPDPINLAEVI
jgi:hypothetical protein